MAGKKRNRGQKKASLRDLSRNAPEDIKKTISELVSQGDRTCAVVCGSLLDYALYRCLLRSFTPMAIDDVNALFHNPTAPLGSMASRIIIAFSMGLIDANDKEQLNIIKNIRNAFAHSLTTIDFSSEPVDVECSKLTGLAFAAAPWMGADASQNGRKFISSVIHFMFRLVGVSDADMKEWTSTFPTRRKPQASRKKS